MEPLSVLMIDIDNFKRFNDTFGHPVGDAALIAVARALSGCLHRAGDVLARYGGEEFAVVMPGVDAKGAITVANRLVQAVRAVTVRQAAGWNVSVSVGAATWRPGAEASTSGELMAEADTALYAAKAAGKDRAYPPPHPAADPSAVTDHRLSNDHPGAGVSSTVQISPGRWSSPVGTPETRSARRRTRQRYEPASGRQSVNREQGTATSGRPAHPGL